MCAVSIIDFDCVLVGEKTGFTRLYVPVSIVLPTHSPFFDPWRRLVNIPGYTLDRWKEGRAVVIYRLVPPYQ